MENSIPTQISNFLTHQPNEPSGNMALHSSGNAYKAIPLSINYKFRCVIILTFLFSYPNKALERIPIVYQLVY